LLSIVEEVAMPDRQEIKVNFPPNLQVGVFSNNMVVTHTKKEFILDFIMVARRRRDGQGHRQPGPHEKNSGSPARENFEV